MSDLELFQRFPSLRKLSYVPLGRFPTPIRRLEEVGIALKSPNVFVKDDSLTGPLYGGNKVRKLEFLLGDAIDQGYDTVWTVGAVGSHHVLATCIYARSLDLQCGALHVPQPVTDHVRKNLLALSTTNADLTLATDKARLAVHLFKAKLRAWLATKPEAYYIPGGGSSMLGVLGYLNAAFELAAQIGRGEVPAPDVIYVAAGTCSTLAGLILGTKLAGLECRVVGVRVVETYITNRSTVVRLVNGCAAHLEALGLVNTPRIRNQDVEMVSEFFGKGYGIATDAGLSACALAAQDGLNLEPTYTAKAFSALAAREEQTQRTVLYWHTLSGVDLSERIAKGSIDALPTGYHGFFDGHGDGDEGGIKVGEQTRP
jgi:1-aminocyclopropane-1-carboxylate deaminase/D-cysteine desulfhydrase-like pyridoxal-dependent ACC family enzyme